MTATSAGPATGDTATPTTADDVMTTAVDPTADAVAERLFASALGAMDVLAVYLGDRLGWYASLRTDGPATPAELAARTGTRERYAREWLEQQAVFGMLRLERGQDADRHRYVLPAGAAEALTDSDSLAYLGPIGRLVAATASRLPELLDAYRNGGGVSWEQPGEDARVAQAEINRPWFTHVLPGALAGVPDIHDVLRRPGARIVDIGCGGGWSTLALAGAYPEAVVEGLDVDAPSIAMAREAAAAAPADVAARVSFRVVDGTTLADEQRDQLYDAAFALECIHDLAQPVEVLAAIRAAVRPDGVVVVMDEAVAEELTAPGDDLERFMYGCSLLVCLPDGLSSEPSAGTGTVMRHGTLDAYARTAGFDAGASILPIEGFGFWRFYRLAG